MDDLERQREKRKQRRVAVLSDPSICPYCGSQTDSWTARITDENWPHDRGPHTYWWCHNCDRLLIP
ncbi:hypothetical protein ACFT30_13575 [Microbacterium ureisolvens]|uniref:hypothetical protein n=1 Tax=Microbacterium ureisolvens TaxID=2781186 RepID=UPI0036275727